MIDFHTHILPEMDDGSHSLEETRKMLRIEYEQGVRKVLATPHFYANSDFPDKFLIRREKRLGQVRAMLEDMSETEDAMPDLQICGGAEVYYFSGMSASPMLPKLCIEDTSVLLLELPFGQWDGDVYRETKKIIERRKLTVILAHVERYYGYQKNMEVWEQIMELPLYVQMNAGAFLDWKKRRTAMKLLKQGYDVILGSDCHDTERRPPDLAAGRDVIRRKAGDALLNQIDCTGKRVLG